MFCSALQYRTRSELLVGYVGQEVKPEEVLKHEEPATQNTTIIEMELKALHYVCTPLIYSSEPQAKGLQHMSFAEYTI